MIRLTSVYLWTERGLEALGAVALALWFGGFTFYAGDVLWILHEDLGSIEAGFISQRVSNDLNLLGLVAILLLWLTFAFKARSGLRRFGLVRLAMMSISSVTLIGLFVLHAYLDQRLEQHGLTGFYRWHEMYLIISTVQWAANLLLLIMPAMVRSHLPARS